MKYKYTLFGAMLAALALSLVFLQILYSLPTERKGRVYRYTAYITIGKEPEDDPFDSDIVYIITNCCGTTARPCDSDLTLTAGDYKWVTIRISVHPTLDILTEVQIISVFSFTSTTTATQRLRCDFSGTRYHFFIYSRMYEAGKLYRWVITIPAYISDNLVIHPLMIPALENRFYFEVPTSIECGYLSGDQIVYSSSGLSYFKLETRHSDTTVSDLWRISFGSAWDGRYVVSCSIFTTDTTVLNGINTRLSSSGQRMITSGRLYMVMINNINTVIQAGDAIEVQAYYNIATSY